MAPRIASAVSTSAHAPYTARRLAVRLASSSLSSSVSGSLSGCCAMVERPPELDPHLVAPWVRRAGAAAQCIEQEIELVDFRLRRRQRGQRGGPAQEAHDGAGRDDEQQGVDA